MSYGLYFLNQNFGWQLDDTRPVKSLRTKGTINPGVQAKPQYFSVSFNSNYRPTLALRAINCHAALEYVVQSGSTFTFYYFCVLATPGASITHYIFDRPPPQPRSSGWGFELYNAAGQVVASDLYPPMKLMAVEQGEHTGTYPGGRVYAQVAPQCIWSNATEVIDETSSPVPVRIDKYAMGGWRWDGTTLLNAANDSDQAAAHSYADTTGFPAMLMVIDVTNL